LCLIWQTVYAAVWQVSSGRLRDDDTQSVSPSV
jgi:hypothetical protein